MANLKWRVALNGQGNYWWKAETPLGPVYTEFRTVRPMGWAIYWYPADGDTESHISGGWDTEDTAKDEAERWIKAYTRKVAKKLARFAK